MFIVENGKITSEKVLDLGKLRSIDLAFAFDLAFEDADKFQLSIAETKNALYGFTNSGKLSFASVDFSFIAEAEKTVAISIKQNGTEILADELTVTAVVSGGGGGADLGSYKGKISIASETAQDAINFTADENISNLALGFNQPNFKAPTFEQYPVNIFTKGWSVGVVGGNNVTLNGGGSTILANKSGITIDAGSKTVNLTGQDFKYKGGSLNQTQGLCLLDQQGKIPFYVSEPYIQNLSLYEEAIPLDFSNGNKVEWWNCNSFALNFSADIENFYYKAPNETFIYPDQFCLTKEIWVHSSGEIESISVPWNVQVIGELPENLASTAEIADESGTLYEKDLAHVFVARRIFYNGKSVYTLNYSHSFIYDYNF